MSRGRRFAVAGVLVLAVVTGFVAVMSTWVKRQALDTNNWTNTSSQLLADNNVQQVLGAYLVNELFTNVDVAGQLRQALPSQAQALAGPAACGSWPTGRRPSCSRARACRMPGGRPTAPPTSSSCRS
jgi:hypothetical protein